MFDRRALFLVALGVFSMGCRQSGRLELHDTEGRTFAVQCTGDTGCRVQATGAELRSTGRVVGVCQAPSGRRPGAIDCRALTCKSDDDCPGLHHASHGSCLHGLCEEPGHAINVDDAVMLCLAGSGPGHSSPRQVERYALAENCGRPCKVPAPCRQP